MKLITQVKLLPSPAQRNALRLTLETANYACNVISDFAWEKKVFRQFDLHKVQYFSIKEQFDLSSQVVVRCLAKVANSYKLDKRNKRVFRKLGAIAYDNRILRWYTQKSTVSIWTMKGREIIPFVCGDSQRVMLEHQQGECDLVLRGDTFFLMAVCNIDESKEIEVHGVLGVDLGIVNLAVDSDGTVFSGDGIEKNRQIYAHRRRNLQHNGSKSAMRKLKRLSGKQKRFQRDVNHQISKQIVQKAYDTKRAIALEDLFGIRTRTTVRRKQRARYANWSFFQLR